MNPTADVKLTQKNEEFLHKVMDKPFLTLYTIYDKLYF